MKSSSKATKSDIRVSEKVFVYHNLLSVFRVMFPFTVILLLLLPSYFPFISAWKMIFSGPDGNCVIGGVNFGNHCFGDYGVILNQVNEGSNPWLGGSPLGQYPPLVLVLMKFFSWINNFFSPAIALVSYLLTIALSAIYPIIDATRKSNIQNRIEILAIFGLLSLPVIAAVDRGNNTVWSIPFLYLAIKKLHNNESKMTVIYFAIAIALRPQTVILLLILFPMRRYREFIRVSLFTPVLYFGSFILYLGKLDMSALGNFANNVRNYGSGIPGDWPPSLSFAKGIKEIIILFNINITDVSIIRLANVIVLVVLLVIILNFHKRDSMVSTILIIPLVFLVAPMTWWYYGSYLTIVLAILIRERFQNHDFILGKFLPRFYLLCIFLTTTLLNIPILPEYGNLVQYLVPISWVLFYLILIPAIFKIKGAKR